MRTSQEILAQAAQTAGLRYVSKAEAKAGMPVPENQKSWLETLKAAIADEEHLGDSSDVLVGIDVKDATTDVISENNDTTVDSSEKWKNAGVQLAEKPEELELETA